MNDFFALLKEERRPWLDPDLLKQKFLALSTEAHPDRVHNAAPSEKEAAQQRYTTLNTAYNTLREPKDRLKHLLELELGQKPKDIERIPPALMELFMEVGQLCRQTDAFLAEQNAAKSPLIQVQMFERAQEWTEKLMALQTRINNLTNELIEELKTMDGTWNVSSPNHADHVRRLEELYRLFSYFARWGAQMQERIVQLAF